MTLFYGPGTDKPVLIATDVRDFLPEKNKYQYRDGRSMAEAAKSWVTAAGFLPPSIASIVKTNVLESAHFEFPTPVWGGGIAMTDVMAYLPNCVIAVEAKVDEPFDEYVAIWIDKNAEKITSPPNRRNTIERYARALNVTYESLQGIRYQLLQRSLCAALTAKSVGHSNAWMIVQCFALGNVEGHQKNRSDFNNYLALIGNTPMIEGVRVQIAWAEGH